MTPVERMQTALNGLGLKAIEARLEGLLEQASKKKPNYADFLDELLSCEVESRRTRYLRARLQLAHLPFVKNFDQFDFGFQPSIDERQIRELRTLRFVHVASNVVFLGPPGVGKTHLSVALAEAAIQSGSALAVQLVVTIVDSGRATEQDHAFHRWAAAVGSSVPPVPLDGSAQIQRQVKTIRNLYGVRRAELTTLRVQAGSATVRFRCHGDESTALPLA
jgi:hypothetical protein